MSYTFTLDRVPAITGYWWSVKNMVDVTAARFQMMNVVADDHYGSDVDDMTHSLQSTGSMQSGSGSTHSTSGEAHKGQNYYYSPEEIEQLTGRIDEQQREIDRLKDDKRDLIHKNGQLKSRSDEITSKMAEIMSSKSDFENTGDEFSNTKLVRRFDKLQQSTWVSLLECMLENNGEEQDEIHYITKLTTLMESCYTDGVLRKANAQIQTFLFLQDDEEIPKPTEEPALYQVRREHSQRPNKLEKVKQGVLNELELSEEDKKEDMTNFLQEFIECSWLMTISHHPLALNFNVVGRPFTDKLNERFKKYATQEDVVDEDKAKGTITQVVWPCVEYMYDGAVVSKGEVITVDKGRQSTDV